FLVFDARGTMVLAADAEAVRDGEWVAKLPADTTQALKPGANHLEVAVAPKGGSLASLSSARVVSLRGRPFYNVNMHLMILVAMALAPSPPGRGRGVRGPVSRGTKPLTLILSQGEGRRSIQRVWYGALGIVPPPTQSRQRAKKEEVSR